MPELHLQTSDVLLGKPNQRHIVRTTVSCTQATTRKQQFSACTHAAECSGGPQRKAKIQENAGTTGGRRQNAAASESARSPSLRLPQPRVPQPRPAAALKAHREHRRKCGGRTRQPRSPLTRCLGEMPTALACRRRAALSRGAQHFTQPPRQFLLVFSFQSFQLSIQISGCHQHLQQKH